MNNLLKRIILFLGILTFAGISKSSSQLIITGSTVNSKTYEKVPFANISFVKNGLLIGSTLSDINGNYNTSLTSVKAKFPIKRNQDYKWSLFDISGRRITSGENRDGHIIRINNLASGVYFLRLEVDGVFFVQKILNLKSSNNSSRMIEVIPQIFQKNAFEEQNQYLGKINFSTNDTNTIAITRKIGFEDDTTQINAVNGSKIDLMMNKISVKTSFFVKTYNTIGEIANPTFTIIYSDTIFDVVAQNGTLKLNHNDYKNTPDTIAKITQTNPEFLKWIIGQTKNQKLNEKNLFQSQKIPNANAQIYWPIDSAKIPLNKILTNDTLSIYVIPQRVEHPYIAGQFINLDSDTVGTMIVGSARNTLKVTTKYVPVNNGVPGMDTVYIFQFTKLYNSASQPTITDVSTANLDRAKTVLDTLLNAFTLQNGKRLFPEFKFIRIPTHLEPEYQYISAAPRSSDNRIYTDFAQVSTPSNGVSLKSATDLRMKSSNATYSTGETNGTIFSELYSALTNMEDPSIGGSLGPFVSRGTPNQITKLGKHMIGITCLMDVGTKY